MTVRTEQQGEICRVVIEGEMTIYQAGEHLAALRERLGTCRELELDLSEVSEIDSAGLQLLLVFKRAAEAAGRQLRLANHSRAVYEVLEMLNMERYFGDPMVIPAEWTQR